MNPPERCSNVLHIYHWSSLLVSEQFRVFAILEIWYWSKRRHLRIILKYVLRYESDTFFRMQLLQGISVTLFIWLHITYLWCLSSSGCVGRLLLLLIANCCTDGAPLWAEPRHTSLNGLESLTEENQQLLNYLLINFITFFRLITFCTNIAVLSTSFFPCFARMSSGNSMLSLFRAQG